MINVERFLTIKLPGDILAPTKEGIAYGFFYLSILLSYYGSLNPWFLWPLGKLYIIPASILMICSVAVSATMKKGLFNRNNFLPAILAYMLLVFYQAFVNNQTPAAYIIQIFHITVFYSLFRMNIETVQRLSTIIARTMAVLLCVSIPFFLLYLIGFPLPSISVDFGDYSYSNYFFFLIDDRFMLTIIPRFHSVFLEPGQMGTATVLLLLTQIGKWKKWYNIVLIIATILSFSLGAYVLFFVTIFLNLWLQKKGIIKKLLLTIALTSTVVVGSFYYNDGFNLLHDLIIMRLEVHDGEMEGDNRVADTFQADYDTFLESSDIFLGKDYDRMWGNSGYKVYFYDYGLVGLLLLALFYILSLGNSKHKRSVTATLIIAVLSFYVRDFPLWYAFYIPYFCTAQTDFNSKAISINDNSIHP